jgi:hypothetical protein
VFGGEGVAVARVGGAVAAVEPGAALPRGAVGEGVGSDGAGLLLLQPVVADRPGRAEGLLDVAFVQVALLIDGGGPDPGVAVGL